MIELFNGQTGEMLGTVTEDQLDQLIDLMSDGGGSESYTIDAETIGYLQRKGVPKSVITLLKGALGERKTVTVEYHIQDELDIDFGEEE